MLPGCELGRPQGPPLWDPARCCPLVSVCSWGGLVPPRPSICDRSTVSGSGGRRRGRQGRPGSGPRGDAGPGGEAQGCVHSVTRSLSRGGARGEAGAGLQGPAWSWSCRQSLPDSLAAWGPVRPRALPEGPVRACPCRPPWSARRLLEKRAVCCCVRVAPQRLRCQRLRRPGPTCFLGAPCSVPRPHPRPRGCCVLLLLCRDLSPGASCDPTLLQKTRSWLEGPLSQAS